MNNVLDDTLQVSLTLSKVKSGKNNRASVEAMVEKQVEE